MSKLTACKFVSVITALALIASLGTAILLGSACSNSQDSISALSQTDAPASMLQFTSGGHVLGFDRQAVYLAGMDHALRVDFDGSHPVQPVAEGTGTANDGATPLGKVSYFGAWKNIDVVYSAVEGGIAESTYIVKPGGDPSDISLGFNTPVEIAGDGCLRFSFENGYMTESAPVAWQEIDGERLAVAVEFEKRVNDNIGFALATYDPGHAIYVDPVYVWHTFYGSSGTDYGWAITLDPAGNIYVAGVCAATWNGPGGVAPLNPYTGGNDITVVKLSNAGTYQWHAFYGCSGTDYGLGIAVDGAANVFITGESQGAWNGPGGTLPKNAYTGSSDIVVIKLNTLGAYQWHSFYGSAGMDRCYGIDLDGAGSLYLAGWSQATWNGPGPTAPRNAHSGGFYNWVILKLSNPGVYQWHTFYGSDLSNGWDLVLDVSGNIYVCGNSYRTWDGPGSAAPLNPHTAGDNYDIAVLKLNNAGDYVWHTFYGSAARDDAKSIDIDPSGFLYITGESFAGWNGPGGTAPLNAYVGTEDVYVLKLNSAGGYVWHTFYGSATGNASGFGIAVNSSGDVFITGWADATWDGPGGVAPIYPYTANYDNIIIELNSSGAYLWHTFYGGPRWDLGYGIALDAASNTYVTGQNDNWNGPNGETPLNAFAGGSDIVVIKTSAIQPTAVTQAATALSPSEATLNMRCTTGGFSTVGVRFAYKKKSASAWTNTPWINRTAPGQYARKLTGLDAASYQFRAEVRYNAIVIQGNILQFTVPSAASNAIGSGAVSNPSTVVSHTDTSTRTSSTVSLPNVKVQSASLSADRAAGGSPVTVTAVVINSGGADGSAGVKLYVNGVEESSRGVTLASGENNRVDFTVTRNEPGTYTVYVDGINAGSFTVDRFSDPNIILYISGALLLLALVLGILFILRRRQAVQ